MHTNVCAQVWLAITNLVVEPKSRAKYGFDEWRRDCLLTLKRFMNELLFDQIPVRKGWKGQGPCIVEMIWPRQWGSVRTCFLWEMCNVMPRLTAFKVCAGSLVVEPINAGLLVVKSSRWI